MIALWHWQIGATRLPRSKKLLKIEGAENSHGAYIIAPKVDREETAHFILRVTDKGEPRLTSYKRVIVTIKP